jgi:branched-chain amino acid transport system substrate-binding protein
VGVREYAASLLVGLSFVASRLGLIFLISSSAYAEPKRVEIGTIFGMTGTYSQYALWGSRGTAAAAEEWNSSTPSRDLSIALVPEDHAGSSARAVSAYMKLRQQGVKYFLTSTSSVALAIAPLAIRDGVVQIDVSSTSPKYSSPNDCTFRTSFLAEDLATEAAKQLKERFNLTSLAVFTADNEFGEGIHDTLHLQLGDLIVARERFSASGGDFRAELLRLKGKNPAALWITGAMREAALAVKQARALGLNVPIYSDAVSVEASDFLAGAGSAAEGLVYFVPRFDPNATASSIGQRYLETYAEPSNYYVGQSYDAVRALAQAFGACGSDQVSCVCDHLRSSEFSGAFGASRFDSNGDMRRVIEAKTIRNGKFSQLRE